MARLLLINGPNLNLLGSREPERYGRETLAEIEHRLVTAAQTAGHEMVCVQSNHEGVIVDRIHAARDEHFSFAIINPGALTHTSIALRDALLGTALPFIEIHISNIFAREDFRQHSYLSDVASGIICGLGSVGYDLALAAALQRIDTNT